MVLAPIVLFVYNRLQHTIKTIEALKKNELASKSVLYIYSDGPKNLYDETSVIELRKYLYGISGFFKVSIIERSNNFGLSDNIIEGVTSICNKYGKVIVLEDDLVTSPFFLTYMNEGIDKYINHKNVCSIHGYVYPISDSLPETFFIKGADCWGWATWTKAWNNFEIDGKKLLAEIKYNNLTKEFNFNNSFDYVKMLEDQICGRNNSWAIRWYASCFLNNMYTLYPGKSLISNIGFDGSGTHSGRSLIFNQEYFSSGISIKDIPVKNNEIAYKAFVMYFTKNKFYSYRWKKVIKKILPINIIVLLRKIF